MNGQIKKSHLGTVRVLARFLLRLAGWTVKGSYNDGPRNCVIIVAPHTSQWDFLWGLLARTVYGIRAKYLIKDSFFKPGIAWFFHLTGGIAVDRSKKNELTAQLKQMLNDGQELKIVFTPEGTRKRVDRWKSGFYWVALDTGLPIVMHYMDYAKKEIGRSEPFTPSGDWDQDRPHFEAYYSSVTAHNPENFNKQF